MDEAAEDPEEASYSLAAPSGRKIVAKGASPGVETEKPTQHWKGDRREQSVGFLSPLRGFLLIRNLFPPLTRWARIFRASGAVSFQIRKG